MKDDLGEGRKEGRKVVLRKEKDKKKIEGKGRGENKVRVERKLRKTKLRCE